MEEPNERLELTFSETLLEQLNKMINEPRWVVPVLPGGQLEVLQKSAIALCRAGTFICRLFQNF